MTPQIHPTAEIEPDVEIGPGTAIWSHVHVRGGARIGSACILGEQTYIGPGVEVGDRVKLNAFVYVCAGVVIEDGVMVSAGSIFTNDPYPRATTPDLQTLRHSAPEPGMPTTFVREGATIGAGAVIGPGLEIGRFAMVGMGAVVTRSIAPFHMVTGTPATTVGCVCRCGRPLLRITGGAIRDQVRWSPSQAPAPAATVGEAAVAAGDVECAACGLRYKIHDGEVAESAAP